MTSQNLIALLEDVTKEPNLKLDTELVSLAGWNSLSIMSLLAELDKQFGIEVNPADLDDCESISDLSELLGAD